MDPLLKHRHGPALGRKFDVYFNRLKVGSLMLQAKTEILCEELSGMYIWLDLEQPHLFEQANSEDFFCCLPAPPPTGRTRISKRRTSKLIAL